MFSFLVLTNLINLLLLINFVFFLTRRRKKAQAQTGLALLRTEFTKTGMVFNFLYVVLFTTGLILPQFFPEVVERFQVSALAFSYCFMVWVSFLTAIAGIFCGLIGFPFQKKQVIDRGGETPGVAQ